MRTSHGREVTEAAYKHFKEKLSWTNREVVLISLYFFPADPNDKKRRSSQIALVAYRSKKSF